MLLLKTVTIELQRVTTDQSGHYQFDNLQNGTYTVEFAIPDNYTPSPANNSTNDAIDSDGERDGTRKVVVAKGTINNADNMTVDTGFYLTLITMSEIMYGKIQIKMVSKMTMKREFQMSK